MKTINYILKLADQFLKTADENYELLQEYLDSNPKELDTYLNKNKMRQKEWRAKQDQEKLLQMDKEKRKRQLLKHQELAKSKTIDGLLFVLGKQIANKKSRAVKNNNQKELEIFTPISKRIHDWRFAIKEYLYGIDPNTEMKSATPDTLYKLIESGKKLLFGMDSFSIQISDTLKNIIILLQEMADNYTARTNLETI